MEQKTRLEERKEKILFSYKETKMRIAICDRDITFLKKLKMLLYRYAEQKRLDILVDCYSCGEDMLNSGVRYNLVFLGYHLTGRNGLEIARLLRRKNDFTTIIFMSSDTHFVFDAFKVSAYRFLVRPLKEKEFFSELDDFFEKYGNDYPLWVKSREDTVCLNTGDIYYLEADNKHCYIHLEKDSIPCNRTMARVFEVMPKRCFIKINRAYIINLNFVTKYNSDQVYLKNGKALHISRNYLKSFKKEYFEFSNPRMP